MDDQSRSTRFRAHFDAALRVYEKKTGIILAEHSLTLRLQSYPSAESITTLIQDQIRASSDSRGIDRIAKSVESTISIISALSANTAFEWAIDMTFSPETAIQAGFVILLAAAKESSYDPLVDLLESIEHLLRSIDIYTQIPHTPALDEMVVKTIAELLCTLGLATKGLTQGRLQRFVDNHFGEQDVEAALQRLGRLSQDEARMTALEILKVVHGLLRNLNIVMDDGQPSVDSVWEALEILHKIASDIDQSKRDKLRGDIRNWLFPPDPWKNHHIACESRHEGTATWFLQGDTFSEWKISGPSSLLWLHGKPGAGKSVLCSTIIGEIEAMRRCGLASLAFYYHDFREDQKRDRRGLLSSVLFQLCDQSNPYHKILSTFYSDHRDGAQNPSDDELAGCLKNFLGLPGQAPVYLIIDALDECQDTSTLPSPREKVLTLLEDLVHSRLPNLRICVTSRPEADIKQVLEPLTFFSVSIHEESGQMQDIEKYINSTVNSNRKMRRWKLEHKQLVIDNLTKRADGMFRWAYCQLEYLSSCLPGSILHALDYLPETLDGTYERTLREIKSTNWEFARRLFLCVTAAKRALSVEELAEFLAFDFKAGSTPKFREDWRLEDPLEAVMSTCSTLLVLVHVDDSQIIQFSHYSVKEFLTSTRFGEKRDTISCRYHISMTSAHTLVAQACFGILLHLDESTTRNGLTTFPLTEYAAKHWIEHVRFEGVSEKVEEGMKQLVDPSKPHFTIWIWLCMLRIPWTRTRQNRAKKPLPPSGSLLHGTVESLQHMHSQGFSDNSSLLQQRYGEAAHLLIGHDTDTTAQGVDLCTPLLFTVLKGREGLIRWSIQQGTNTTVQDNPGSAPSNYAMQAVDFIRLFVRHCADVTAQDNDRSSASTSALLNETAEFIRLLVEHFAYVRAQNNDPWTPLLLVVQEGSVSLARLLVKLGADVTAHDNQGWTPLHWAVQAGSMDLTRLFVEYGADVQALDNDGSTPLGFAVEAERDDLMAFLAHAVDTTAQAAERATSLKSGAQVESVDLARLFTERGSDATTQDAEGSTPLHLVVREGSIGLARLLVEEGADVRAQDDHGWTPLHWAVQAGSMELARLLIEYGADVTTRDDDGLTPLGLAVQAGREDLASLLMDATVQDTDEATRLNSAVRGEIVEPAPSVADRGPNVMTNAEASTSTHLPVQVERTDLAHSPAEHSADATVQDADESESTLLHLAVQGQNVDLARSLVENGADVTAQDNYGWTPLHWAVYVGSIELARLFIGHGAYVTAQNHDGLTPLDFALEEGRDDLIGFLVDHAMNATAQDADELAQLDPEVQAESVELTNLATEYAANSTAQDVDGSTPTPIQNADRDASLHSAVQEEDAPDHTHVIVEHDADATQDPDGITPLNPAVLQESVGIKRLHAEHDADATAKDASESTPSHLVVQEDSVDHTRLLVEHDVDTTVQDGNEAIPSHSSTQEGSTEPAHLPIEKSEEITTQDKSASTPLHVEHGAQDNQGRLRRVMRPFLDATELVLVGLLFCWIVNLKSYYY